MARVKGPELDFAFEARVRVDRPVHIGHSPHDVLGFVPILGGTVDGPLLRGTVVPGGGDWNIRRGTTVYELDARYLIRAEDGSHIDVVNRGYFRADPEVMARADAGEQIGDDELYFRTSPTFRTDAPAHRWMAEHVFVGLAREDVAAGDICIRFFVVR